MGQHSAPTRRPGTRTLATLSAMALASSAGFALAPQAHAADTPKPVKINGNAAPRIIDNPGTGKDAVRLTNIPGVRWAVTGNVDTKWKDPLATPEKYVDVPITKDGTSAVVTATPASGYTIGSDITTWTLPFTTTTVNVATTALPVALDYPGTKKDAIQLTVVPGVTWSVNDKTVPPFVGTKAFPLVKLGLAEGATTATVKATLADGYAGTISDTSLTFTVEATVNLATATVDKGIAGTVNLPGRTRDTITFAPIPGVKWSVCGGKPFAVTKVTTKSASCSTNPVPLVAYADKGYTIDAKATYEKTVTMPDTSGQAEITIPASPVTAVDAAGALNDTVTIKPVDNVTWQYAFPGKPGKDGKVTLKWSKAPKPSKTTGVITVKLKAVKGQETNTIYVRPVVDTDDFVIKTGWTPDGDFSAQGARTFTSTTKPGELDLKATDVTAAATTNDVTLPAKEGVSAWTVVRTVKVGDKEKALKSVVKVAPYGSVVVQGFSATKVTVTPVLDKSYAFKDTSIKTWDFPALAPVPAPGTP